MTWPLGRLTDVVIPASDDVHFSIWRLAWVAHQLPCGSRTPLRRQYFPSGQGTRSRCRTRCCWSASLGLPFFQAGINPALVHNYLMLAAIVSSMLCAFALARRLTGSERCGVAGRDHLRTGAIPNGAHRPPRAAVDDVDAAGDVAAASADGRADARARIAAWRGAGGAGALQHLLRTVPRLLSRGGLAGDHSRSKRRKEDSPRQRRSPLCRCCWLP